MKPTLQSCADALWQARETRVPIGPLRDWLAPDAINDAYAVQSIVSVMRLARGDIRIGRKIGLTSVAVQKQLGVDQPDFGVLFNNMLLNGPSAVQRMSEMIAPKIEGEIAFIIAEDITEKDLPRDQLARKAGDAAAAFEIVDSAIADWKITLADTVADNASCGAIVLGAERKSVASNDFRLAGMVLSEDGKVVSLGVGAATLGDPLTAFAWLANKAIELGDPLRAGEIVITGALGPMMPMTKGKRYRLEIAGFSPLDVFAE